MLTRATYNWDSINDKVNAYLDSNKGKKKAQKATEDRITKSVFLDIQKAFVDILTRAINVHRGRVYAKGGLGQRAIAELEELAENVQFGAPYRSGDQYYVDIVFNGNLYRESIVPEQYGGIDNIIALLNNGYTASHSVYGRWNSIGEEIYSIARRGGAHFINEAIRAFYNKYKTKYNLVNVEKDSKYE